MSLAQRLEALETRLSAACAAVGRPRHSVRLLAVSKTQPAALVSQAAALGLRAFGENYVQEALVKLAELAALRLEWHHIGLVQSNKTADIAAHFDWVQGVDRLKIAERLSAQRPAATAPLNLCVQVNVSGEASKSGCPPASALALCRAVQALPGVRLRGLMALPAPLAATADPREPFARMRRLFEQLQVEAPDIDTLSMGMSDDLELAIAEGATLVRVGSALFGPRAGKLAP